MKRILVVAVAIVAVLALVFRPPASAPIAQSSARPPFLPRPPRGHATASDTVVYVAGAVKRPGIYHVRGGARADDGVRAAGGMLETADAAGVNLAERVSDGEEILVPLLGEPTPHARTRRKTRTRSAKANVNTGIVELNSASADMLASVPGIGKTIAERIVEVRERDGPYLSFDDLLDVAGMTQKRLELAAQYLHI